MVMDGFEHLLFSGVASCDDGSGTGAEQSLLASTDASPPFGGLWKHSHTHNYV